MQVTILRGVRRGIRWLLFDENNCNILLGTSRRRGHGHVATLAN